jgi:hypothetical protein
MREPRARADLFYDRGCGPCTWFAHASRGLGGSRIRIAPLDGELADRELREMTEEVRYGAFQIAAEGQIYTGEAALPVWIGLVAGRTAEQVVDRVGVLRSAIARVYRSFWEYRRTRGCSAADASPA